MPHSISKICLGLGYSSRILSPVARELTQWSCLNHEKSIIIRKHVYSWWWWLLALNYDQKTPWWWWWWWCRGDFLVSVKHGTLDSTAPGIHSFVCAYTCARALYLINEVARLTGLLVVTPDDGWWIIRAHYRGMLLTAPIRPSDPFLDVRLCLEPVAPIIHQCQTPASSSTSSACLPCPMASAAGHFRWPPLSSAFAKKIC